MSESKICEKCNNENYYGVCEGCFKKSCYNCLRFQNSCAYLVNLCWDCVKECQSCGNARNKKWIKECENCEAEICDECNAECDFCYNDDLCKKCCIFIEGDKGDYYICKECIVKKIEEQTSGMSINFQDIDLG